MIKLLFLMLIPACLMLANRDTGMFADADNYVEYFSAAVSDEVVNAEPSFVFIAKLINLTGSDVRGLFFVYLFLGFFLKSAFFLLKMPGHLKISLIYFTSYFVVHDLVQIRIGAALGVALWAVFLLDRRKLWASIFLWMISFALHFSTLLLALISISLYLLRDNKVVVFGTYRITFASVVFAVLLLFWYFLWGTSLASVITGFFSDFALIPKRYSENYIYSSEVVGVGKMLYSFMLAVVAVYALRKKIFVDFISRHAAVCLALSFFVLVAFNDMPVIASRLADTLLFFAPLMIFGIYRARPVFGAVLLSSMLIVQTTNLFLFSKIIFTSY